MARKKSVYNPDDTKEVTNEKGETSTKTQKELVLAKIEQIVVKGRRDAMPTWTANSYVQAHTSWVHGVVNSFGETIEDDASGTAQYELIEGKLPFVLIARDILKAEYNNSLFKSPDILFNLDCGNPNINEKLKQYHLQELIKGGSINSYMQATEKFVNRGEFILFHTWEKRMKLNEDGEEVLAWEGSVARAIEPHDFLFDTTKLPDYSSTIYDNVRFAKPSCFKMTREWLSVNDILNTYDVSKEDEDKLRALVKRGTSPATELSRDNFTDRLSYRHVFGNVIEVWHYVGDIDIDNETLENYYIIVAGNQVVLRCKPEDYKSGCRFTWCPNIVDPITLRGLSRLIPAVYMNQIATSQQLAIQDAQKQALDPSFLVPEGTHLTDDKKSIERGTLNECATDGGGIGAMGGNFVQMFKEIDGYKNIPILTQNIQYYEQKIKDVTATNTDGNSSPIQGAPDKTALQSMAEITSGCTRFSDWLIDICKMGLLPAIETHIKMTGEFTDKVDTGPDSTTFGQPKMVNVKTTHDGNTQTEQIPVELLKQESEISIGSVQAIIEKKAKLTVLMSKMQFMHDMMGVQFDSSIAWSYLCSTEEIQDADKWIQSDPLQQMFSQMPPPMANQMKQMFVQIGQNPQLMQHVQQDIQQATQPQQQTVQVPFNQEQNDTAAQAIWTDNKLPLTAKMSAFQRQQIVPNQGLQIEIQNAHLQQQKKQQEIQMGQALPTTPGSQVAKGI